MGLSEPKGKNLVLELSGREKDRVRGYGTFIRGGGHALLGANAAIALRGLLTEAADVSILAKVYLKDRQELVTQYLVNNPAERGIAPASTGFVLNDRTKLRKQGGNVLLVRAGHTTIFPGEQPELRLDDYSKGQREEVLGLLNSADIVAVLSLKSNFMKDVLGLCEDGTLRIPELFCDCTSGDDMDLNYRMLDILLGKGGLSTIGLLSINEDEATLFEMLLVRTDKEEILEANNKKKGLIIELDEAIKDGSKKKEAAARAKIKEVDAFLDKGREGKKDAYSAAHVLYEKTGVPLLMHTREGACIIGGDKSTGFVPSVDITLPNDCSLVGAGDTLCGAFATALAVKKRSDGLLPEDRKLSYEDCLLIANIATGYRLAKINKADKDDAREREWYEAVGKVSELYGWASARTAKRSVGAVLPNGVEFVDVEKNSGTFGGFSEMDSETLLGKVRGNCETNYWEARVAFEELCRNPGHMNALVELVKDSSSAGKIFGKKAAHMLAERGKAGVDMLVEAISSMDDESAFRVVSENIIKLKNPKRAAEIIFGILCTGRLVDLFGELEGQIAPPEFAKRVSNATEELEDKPDFISRMNIFKELVTGGEDLWGFMKRLLSKKGVDLDLIYNLGLLAQKEQAALLTAEINITLSLPKHAGMDGEEWKGFTREIRNFCERRPIAGLSGKEVPETRERLMRKYGLSGEDFNNAIILLLGEPTGWYWKHWPLSAVREYYEMLCVLLGAKGIAASEPKYQLLRLLEPPYTDRVRLLLLLYNEGHKRSDSDFSIPDKLFQDIIRDSNAAYSLYKKVLAVCLVGQLINPERVATRYRDRAKEIRAALKQLDGRQQTETADRAAAKGARIERDHFMKPTRHKRRFEAAPERMNRMKRIV
ncbi:MAG: hypothetical protein PHQ80_01145 [Candidatus ainarchaeum sp.]|nr:hypothetical protein [Candidatus ainarchaeum sp.]